MDQNVSLQLSFNFINNQFDYSKLESKLLEINEHSNDLDLFFTNLNNRDFKCFNTENANLKFHDKNVSLQTADFVLNIKCTNIIKICDHCILCVYGYFDSYDDLVLKFCNKPIHDVFSALSHTKGSYALVYISLHHRYVIISKDGFGFKSLLVSFQPSLTISNVATDTHSTWYELPPFVFLVFGSSPYLFKRSAIYLHQLAKPINVDYNDIESDTICSVIDKVTDSLMDSVYELCKPIITNNVITILFSGCVDSSLITLVALNRFNNLCIELLNVSFDHKSSPDRITCLFTYEELITLFPGADLRLVLVDVNPEDYVRDESLIYSLSYPNHTHMDLNISASLYYAGSLKGYLFSKEFFNTEFWRLFKNNVAILKSVNFKVTVSKERKSEINIVREPYIPDADHIAENLNMEVDADENDEIPLLEMYKRFSSDSEYCKEYVSKSTYVLIGSGADELFGGYGRHVSAKQFDEKNSFINEINKDILRLWKRNLGRDDRVLNYRNLKALYPFLSPGVIQCLNELPLSPAVIIDFLDPPEWFKLLNIYKNVNPSLLLNSEFLSKPGSRSVSVYINKWILREICFRLGLRHCCNFKKRAIQFGTRSAKIFNRIHNMTNRQASNKGSSTFVI